MRGHGAGGTGANALIFVLVFCFWHLVDSTETRVSGSHSPDWAGSSTARPAVREFWFDTEGPASWRKNISAFATTRPLDHSSGGSNNEDSGADRVIPRPPTLAKMEREALCGQGRHILHWRVQFANVTGQNAPTYPIVLSFQGTCNDGEVLPSYNTSEVALGFNVTGRLTVEINSEDPYQLGFETWQGRLAPYLISFQGYGEAVPPNAPPLPGQAYLDHCPPGMWVSGYQVNTGNVLTRIRIRCSCLKCGCQCLNDQETPLHSLQQTDMAQVLDGGSQASGQPLEGQGARSGTSGCLPPVRGLAEPWCFVDKSTCGTPLFSLSGVPWEYCHEVGDAFAMDTEKTRLGCACKPVFNTTLADGTVIVSAGRCIKGGFLDTFWCPVMPETCNRGAESRLNSSIAGMFDVCVRGFVGPAGPLDPAGGYPTIEKDTELAPAGQPGWLDVDDDLLLGAPGGSAAPRPGDTPTPQGPHLGSPQVFAAPSKHTFSTGQLTGIILGVSAATCFLAVLGMSLWFCVKKRRKRRASNTPRGVVLSTAVGPGVLRSPFAAAADNDWDAESSGQLLTRKKVARGWAMLGFGARPEKKRQHEQHESSASSRSYSKEGRGSHLQGTSAAMLSTLNGDAAAAPVQGDLQRPAGMSSADSSEQAGAETCTAPAFIATLKQEHTSPGPGPLGIPSTTTAAGRPRQRSTFDWELDPGDVEICFQPGTRSWHLLGSGGHGQVYKSVLKKVQPVAVKHIKGIPTNGTKYAREVALLKDLRSPHIIQFLGATTIGGETLLVTELMENGDLYSAIQKQKVSWNQRGRRIMADVARGLAYLHELPKEIIHLDVKSPNVLLTRDWGAKIADVGIARVMDQTKSNTRSTFTFDWAAPEVIEGRLATVKADIFSFGVVLWEVLTGEKPQRGRYGPVQDCEAEINELLMRCLRHNPDERPTARAIVELLDKQTLQMGRRLPSHSLAASDSGMRG